MAKSQTSSQSKRMARDRRPAALQRSSRRAYLRLAACVLGIAVIWLVVLPWVARERRTAAYLRWLDQRGIDPSAMYYTELEAMTPILERLERRTTRRDRPVVAEPN